MRSDDREALVRHSTYHGAKDHTDSPNTIERGKTYCSPGPVGEALVWDMPLSPLEIDVGIIKSRHSYITPISPVSHVI